MKSVENTVFVRFVPPSNLIRRHHVEDLFSSCGPIKKSSIIHATAAKGSTANDEHLSRIDGMGENSVITTSSYGFVKYTTLQDAELAALQMNNRTMKIDNKVTVTVKVELAKQVKGTSETITDVPDNSRTRDNNVSGRMHKQQRESKPSIESSNDPSHLKKTNRLILRNLSFYAKESDIRVAMESFGTVIEVHIPKIDVPNVIKNNSVKATHRGFAFVTFSNEKETEQCLLHANDIMIKERTVQIARSLDKTAYSQLQQATTSAMKSKSRKDKGRLDVPATTNPARNNVSDIVEEEDAKNDDEEGTAGGNSDNDDDESSSSSISDPQNRSEVTSNYDDKTAVAEGRCLFVRNLPFDCTRHDIFDVFRTYGYITSIFIVKDKETNKIPKGTAFVSFQKPHHANKAMEWAKLSSTFVSLRAATSISVASEGVSELDQGTAEGGIVIKGRRLLVDLAVDKETASTLSGMEKKRDDIGHKDRRNLYLKGEGRVDNNEKEGELLWDELPENDKTKRQSAWTEKNTKLRSPIFFINPNRLSIRNLAKHVDEASLKKLIAAATIRALDKNLVTVEDQIAHWRASGELNTREILAKVEETTKAGTIIPKLDPKNLKQSIPSLHIHRDYSPGGNKQLAPSRGFGFVEFEHHIHALACLRELNNNPLYSAEYATGGNHVAEMRKRRSSRKKPKVDDSMETDTYVDADGKIRIPRLIVEFTVENKAKAKQQNEHKAKQQVNMAKQRMENRKDDEPAATKSKPKKSRGALQREKKRKLREHPQEMTDESLDLNAKSCMEIGDADVSSPRKKIKSAKPPKKIAKVDADEVNFSNLVESYQQQALEHITAGIATTSSKQKSGKRWFE
jgi:nucleolar protein 4